MAFQYQPLKPNEFRLLKPSSRSTDFLEFEIVHVSLDSKCSYSALSYTWGAEGDVEKVILSGKPFPVRQNLYDALRALQKSQVVEKYLWIDAICINQGNDRVALDERAGQIQNMRQIYEQATRVVVWLGKPENETNNRLAFAMMENLEKRYRRVMAKGRPYQPLWQRKARTAGQDVSDFELSLTPDKDTSIFDVPGSEAHRAWLGIASLWKARWWTRTWIFQESTIPEPYIHVFIRGIAVLPHSTKVRFCCGDQVTSWPKLSATLLASTVIQTTPGVDASFLAGTEKAIQRLLAFRMQRIQNILRSFLEMLQMFRETECHDPRDKVYAPLCLAPEDVRRYITPDYAGKSVSDVYTDVVRYCLSRPELQFEFLGYIMHRGETVVLDTSKGIKSVLPTWVPDFSENIQISPIPKLLYVPERTTRIGFYDKSGVPKNNEALVPTYQPLGNTPASFYIDGNVLHVSGVFVDILKDILKNIAPDMDAARATAKEKSTKWAVEMKHRYFNGETYSDAYNRTLVLDLIYNELGKPSERGGKYDLALIRKPRGEMNVTEYRYQTNMKVAKVKALALRDIGLSKKLYLLMIPHTAAVGDQVWAIAGGRVLYLLRPVVGNVKKFEYVGECYAHGLMDGDILRRIAIGETNMEQISLV